MAQTLKEIKAVIKQLPNVEAFPAWVHSNAEKPSLAARPKTAHLTCPVLDLHQAEWLESLGHLEGSSSQHMHVVTVDLKILKDASPSQPPPVAQSQVQSLWHPNMPEASILLLFSA